MSYQSQGPLYNIINNRIKENQIVFDDEVDITRYCANVITGYFPLVAKDYYEEYDLEFQFAPTTYKKYWGYYDSWEDLKEWHVLISDDIVEKFAEHYPEKVL